MKTIEDWDPTVHAAPGARFVTPTEYREGRPDYVCEGSAVLYILTEALADAADNNGVIIDFDVREFYTTHMRNALLENEDDEGFRLIFDRFTAFTLQDYLGRLLMSGLLGNRGKGNSFDYRLTLPAGDTMPAEPPTAHLHPAEVAAVARAISDQLESLANRRLKVEGRMDMENEDKFGMPSADYQADLTRIDNDLRTLRELLARLPSTT